MVRTIMSLRLGGELPSSEELIALLGETPTYEGRKGMPIPRSSRTQPHDVWILTLATWQSKDEAQQAMESVAARLRRLAAGLQRLDRSRMFSDLYVSWIQDESQGGFTLPADVVAAAADGQLQLTISLLVLSEDYEEDANPE